MSYLRSRLPVCCTITFALCAATSATADQVIHLRSGNGSIGGTDSQITMLAGPIDSAFSHVLGPADFAGADAGPAAIIVQPNPAWIATLPADSAANWVSTNVNGGTVDGATALYAIDFTITDAALSAASITLNFAADNALGGIAPNASNGLYLNGTAVIPNGVLGGFSFQSTISASNLQSLLHLGNNTLYFDVIDLGGPSGLIFSATISTTAAAADAAPLPSVAIAGMGLFGGLAAVRYRRRNKASAPR